MLGNLNYYGFNRDTIRRCHQMISEANLSHAKTLNIWFTILCLVVLFLSNGELLLVMSGDPAVYLSFFFLALIWDIVVFFLKKPGPLTVRIMVMSEAFFLLAFSLYSSIVQPYMMAVMFPVAILLIAFSYIDTFYLITAALVGASGFLVLTSYLFKPLSIMYVDLYNVVIYLSLALVLHYIFQRVRLLRYIAFYENVDIQHDLEVRSSFDALTGLLNRGRFFTIAGEIMRNKGSEYIAVCLFDLDGFKQINDRLGHQMGDKAIQITGSQLLEGFSIDFGEKWSFEKRAMDEKLSFAGRLGGDEFIVLLRGRKDRKAVRAEVERLLDSLAWVSFGELQGIYSSVGIADVAESERDIDRAYSRADQALYRSKAAGKHTITFAE